MAQLKFGGIHALEVACRDEPREDVEWTGVYVA